MSDSIFTRIINGEIPCHKVYEDDKTFAFLDIHPIQPGHVLVVSKTPAETFTDLNEADAAAIWEAARLLASRLKQVFPDKKRIALLIEGFDVAHAHIHLIPANSHAELLTVPEAEQEPDHTALAATADKIRLN